MIIYTEIKLTESLKNAVRETADTYTCIFEDELNSEEEKHDAIRKADIVFGNVKPIHLLDEAPALKWIQFASAGFDGYRKLKTNAIVTNMRDYFSGPCAETMLAGILALYRGIDEFAILKQEKKWVGHTIRTNLYLLSKRQVIILGAGNIGQRIGKLLSGFDCQVAFYARSANKAIINTPEELLQAIPGADIIIGALPGTAETAGLFTNAMIDAIRPNAIFCNVGRGNLLADESHLVDALMNKRIAGAVLDVTAQEPLPSGHPLWDCPQTILTQHSGGGNLTELEGIVAMFITNFKNFESDRQLMNTVELERGY
ncbi:MAG: D-2-hydroxyacid dehydrogenase [Chitinophagaceae bacterium]|nr:MAG: D-2-hydroxyacid dehydrogenase [Chitinophagaceae bacterium]